MNPAAQYNRPGWVRDIWYGTRLEEICNKTMPKPFGINQLVKKEYDTDDIIDLIKKAHPKGLNDTKQLAKALPGKNTIEFCQNLWDLVKHNVKYKTDPVGSQWVKSPSRLWHDRLGDCKSFSIFIGTTLQNKGIPFRYRFVSFQPGSKIVTHVYIIVPFNGKYITIDAVYKEFNLEKKPYYFKKDLNMEGLHYLSGVQGGEVGKLIDLGNKDIKDISEAEMDLLLARDRLQTEKAIVEGIQGIGALKAERYQDSIDMINDALEVLGDHKIGAIDDDELEYELGDIADAAVSGIYSIADEIYGIGDIGRRKTARKAKRQQRRTARKTKRVARRKKIVSRAKSFAKSATKKTGKFLKKVAKTAKKGVKAVARVATAPARLAIKGILEVALPKAAPFFLYLFITDKNLLSKAPAAVKRKRQKAERIANFIVNGIKMKRKHFMAIVRNGIMKHYKKSPEKVISEQTRGIAGIGVIPVAAIGPLIQIIQKIAKLFHKKGEKVSNADAPSESDWGSLMKKGSAAIKQFNKEVANQPAAKALAPDVQPTSSFTPTDSGSDTGDGGGSFDNGGDSIWNSLK